MSQPKTKRCTKCKRRKKIINFRPRKHLLSSWCKRCEKDYLVAYEAVRGLTKWSRLSRNLKGRYGVWISPAKLREIGDPVICYLCGEHFTDTKAIEIDHVVPQSRGGPTDVPNLKWTHRTCNRLKHDLHLDEMLDLFTKIQRHLSR